MKGTIPPHGMPDNFICVLLSQFHFSVSEWVVYYQRLLCPILALMKAAMYRNSGNFHWYSNFCRYCNGVSYEN